jgi:esterase/lipase superfamily enzyme
MTTVYFATNRQVTNDQDAVGGYAAAMVPPLDPSQITYGTATVTGIDIPSNTQGVISTITDISRGGFSKQAIATLSKAGNDLLVFIHGFDNTFSDAVTRAAFNREWLAASALPRTNTTVIAFSWPSLGKLVNFPDLQEDYKADQHMARNSGVALMTFLANLDPILTAARDNGRRATLLAHSMGNLALESALENWFLNGNGDDMMFDLAVLAAADCRYDTFDQADTAGMKGLTRLAERAAIYFSKFDQVLQLSMFVNLGAKRLGQEGPHNKADTTAFPPLQYMMNDCGAVRDYRFDPMTSHQYYRMSPTVRSSIAAQMAGVFGA